MCVVLTLWVCLAGQGPVSHAQSAGGSALRFYGNGVNQIDRVRIALDGPGRPVDVGAGDMTVEFWMKAAAGENGSAGCTTGADAWITGNIILDRDVFNAGDHGDYGVSLAGGRIAFGVHNGSSGATLCGGTVVADGTWRHIAVTRSADGAMRLYVDGQPDGQAAGPAGDISYRDGRGTSYANDPYLVLGAEKHDYDRGAYPSYSGWLDELRVSSAVRYAGAFARPSGPFVTDGSTAALYHFDEGSGDVVGDSAGAAGGPSNGVRQYGGSPAGPEWSSDTPFAATAETPAIPTATPAPVIEATATETPPEATAAPAEATAEATASPQTPPTETPAASAAPTAAPPTAPPAAEPTAVAASAAPTAAPPTAPPAAEPTAVAAPPPDAPGAGIGQGVALVVGAVLVGCVLGGLALLARARRA